MSIQRFLAVEQRRREGYYIDEVMIRIFDNSPQQIDLQRRGVCLLQLRKALKNIINMNTRIREIVM
jgi:hypothetical protein